MRLWKYDVALCQFQTSLQNYLRYYTQEQTLLLRSVSYLKMQTNIVQNVCTAKNTTVATFSYI